MTRPHLSGLGAAIAAAGLAAPGLAQESYDLGTITLSANRGETTELERSGVTVEVVTKEELEKSGTTRVADYLATLPGISISSDGGIGNATTLRIRGAGGQYIGVYIDGIDVNDPSNPQTYFDFGSLTTADITLIEVLKGSQSALYGSEAIAGVINITTARPTEPGLAQNLSAEYGGYNTRKLSYNIGYLGERGSIAATLSRIETDGFSTADENDGNDEADGHEATRLSFSGEYALTETVTLGGSGFWQKSETEFDTFVEVGTTGKYVLSDGPTHDEVTKNEQFALRGFARVETGVTSHELSAQYYQNDRKSYIDGVEDPYFGQRWNVAYQGQAEIPGATFTFGADATRERFENSSDDGQHDMFGLWGQAGWHLSDQVELVTVLRHDNHSEFGGETTGRISLAYLPEPDTTIRASIGTGFRSPSLYELYSTTYGNTDLTPETSVSYELGVEKRFEAGFVAATLFRTDITDLIDYDFSSSTYAQIEGTSRTQGLELSAGVQLSERFDISAAYTWTESEDPETGDPLPRVPLRNTVLKLDAALTEALKGALSVRHVVDVEDSLGELPNYTVAEMNLRYALSDSTELYLRVENLFDEEYQTTPGYGTSDRAAYFGVRASF